MAIIVPIYLAYFIAGLEAERFKAFASIPLVLFFYVFGQFAIYRARRYRLTRTVWRGVRFWMSGSGWAYAGWSLLWGLGTIAHARPVDAMARERRWNATRCGIPIMATCRAVSRAAAGNSSSAAGGCGCSRRSRSTCFRPRPLSTPPTRRWSGAGGCPESGSAMCGWNPTMRKSALIGLYWKAIGWFALFGLAMAAYLAGCAALMASMHGMPLGGVRQDARDAAQRSADRAGRYRLSRHRAGAQRRDAGLSAARPLGPGDRIDHVHGIEAAANVSARANSPMRSAKVLPTASTLQVFSMAGFQVMGEAGR